MTGFGWAPEQSAFALLIVSSDDQDHRSLQRILERDCRLHRAVSRRETISLVRRYRPKVVICDQVLADGDWRDLLSDLHHEKEVPALIVSSRLADDRLWAEVLNLGGYDLLMKPFRAAEVSQVVKMAARRGSSTGGA
jgi:DNA-binding response OmpR family regulator